MVMRKAFRKFLYLLATFHYPLVKKDYRYFIRDNYYSRSRQLKYVIKDYLLKTRYKNIKFQGEFDQELRYVIPFAYWHHLNGTLNKTISCKNTKEFYFFSDHHEEKHEQRIWELGYSNFEMPNMTHSASFSYRKWVQVPFKSQYKNDIYVYEKPILVIANKYNIEWDDAPLNFYSIPLLEWIINNFSSKYQIIYNRPLNSHIVADNSENLDLNEHQWLKDNYPEVIQLNDLYHRKPAEIQNFNHLQLMVYANCDFFVSAHGGTAALASYFGGHNIILSKRGIEHDLNEFKTIFPALSGATIHHAKSDLDVQGYLEKYY